MGSLKSSRAILAFYRRLPPGYPSAQRCNQRFTSLPCPRLGTFHVFQLFRNGKHIGLDPSVEYRPSCRVLPMGWASSIGIMQQVSRQVLLMKGLPKSLETQKVDGIPRWFTQAARVQALKGRGGKCIWIRRGIVFCIFFLGSWLLVASVASVASTVLAPGGSGGSWWLLVASVAPGGSWWLLRLLWLLWLPWLLAPRAPRSYGSFIIYRSIYQ